MNVKTEVFLRCLMSGSCQENASPEFMWENQAHCTWRKFVSAANNFVYIKKWFAFIKITVWPWNVNLHDTKLCNKSTRPHDYKWPVLLLHMKKIMLISLFITLHSETDSVKSVQANITFIKST